MPETDEAKNKGRPPFLDSLNTAYSVRNRNVVLLTGDVTGPFLGKGDEFLSMEQLLLQELSDKFHMLRMDIGQGVTFYNQETRKEITRICESKDGQFVPSGRERDFNQMIVETLHQPLVALRVMHSITEARGRVQAIEGNLKPICFIIRYAGSLFPSGDFNSLSELDRQRLVIFLNWVSSPDIALGVNLVILVSNTRSEVNNNVLSTSCSGHVEIDLPNADERRRTLEVFEKLHPPGVVFDEAEKGRENFVEDSTGLQIAAILDILEEASKSKKPILRKKVTDEVSKVMQEKLGDIVRTVRPFHTTKDVIGYIDTGKLFRRTFRRCEIPGRAVSAFIISGSNGVGKTFQVEAHACESGRIVIEIANIRGSYLGETERFFELLKWYITTFGRVLILVDEAHTAFGSVHSADAHPTEKRLGGNILKMMGDRRFLGKVLWGLMTSRPDSLDPDVKSRAPIQIPIFDLEGDDRKLFVREIFKRAKIEFDDAELDKMLSLTDGYSARDYSFFVSEVADARDEDPIIPPSEVLKTWKASNAIREQREFQMLIAVQHCSYPNLIPKSIRERTEKEGSEDWINERIEELKYRLRY